MAAGTKTHTLNSNQVLILRIAGGKYCDAEMTRQPVFDKEVRVRIEFIEISAFLERYPDLKAKTPESTREMWKLSIGHGGKNARDARIFKEELNKGGESM